MITGRPPFLGETPVDTVLMVIEQDPINPRALNPRVHRDLEGIVQRCLQKPKDLRYRTAQKLGADLDAYLNNQPVSAREGRFFSDHRKSVAGNSSRRRPGKLGHSLDVAQPGVVGCLVNNLRCPHVPGSGSRILHHDLGRYVRDLGRRILVAASTHGSGHVCRTADCSRLGRHFMYGRVSDADGVLPRSGHAGIGSDAGRHMRNGVRH